MSVGTSPFGVAAAAAPARPNRASRRQAPRAVVRWRPIRGCCPANGRPEASRDFGFCGVFRWSMRLRIALVGVVCAALAAAGTARAVINPQHAGLQVALRAQGLY